MSRKWIQVLRFALGAALLAYLFHRMDARVVGETLHAATRNGKWLGLGLLCTFVGLLTGAMRWQQLLATQGMRLSGWRVFRIFFIGQFFNAFMPGACGGDVARAYYAVKEESKGKRTEAASTVFIDRAIGLFATIAFGCLMVALRLPVMLSQRETEAPALLLVAFLAVSIAGIVVLFRRNLFEHWPFFRALEYRSPLGPQIRRAYDAFYLYRSHPVVMLSSTALSLFNLAFLTLACFCFGRSLEVALPLVDYFTLFPIITVLAAIPLTPGALGMREGLFVGMFGALGVATECALSLSLLVYAGGAAWSLLGGIFFVNYTSSEAVSLRQELEALKQQRAGKAEDRSPPGQEHPGEPDGGVGQ